MNESPAIQWATQFFIVLVFIVNVFITIVFGQCLFWETIKANSAEPPPNRFQWSKARNCGCKQLADYFRRKG